MSNIKVEIKGIDEMGIRYKTIMRKLPAFTEREMNTAALLVQSEAKRSIQKGGGGESVTRYSPTRSHTTSAPGTPPATDTGNLVRSIQIDVKRTFKTIIGIVKSNAKYATALEFGTRDNRIKHRPFMRPALRKMRKKILAVLSKGVNRAL